MDKKFMKIKKLIIPVMTVVVLTSQLMGCASVSSKEMLELLQEGESIEIEVAIPSYFEEEQGTEVLYTWQELGHMDSNKDFRLTFDDLTYVHSAGTEGKNGPMYIDLEGNWTNNSTLYYAMMNKTFIEKYWNSTDVRDGLRESIQSNYVDVDEQSSDLIKDASIINAYFNLINDNEPGYMNPNSTLTRGEFLQTIVKADTPVDKTLKADEGLEALVGESTETLILASQALADSYLDTESKSLDNLTFTGTISKAEAVYTVVHRYFSNELESITGKEGAYADTKNAGNIAQRAKLVTDESKPDRWKAATLSLMLQNPEKGIDEDFYKAYIVAKKVGLLPSGVTETNWDEAITKAETINLLLNTYKAIATRDGYATDQQDGLNEGQAINRGDTTEVNTGSGSAGVSIIVDGEIVEGTALTQAEIDELKANATTDKAKRNVEIYEAIVNNGGYDFGDGGDPITKAVGIPGDASWRRMTDEEAQRIFETADPNSSEYAAAKAELQGAEWSRVNGRDNTVYFDYYEYQKVIRAQLEEVRNSEEYRIVHEEVQSPEEGSDEWRAALGWD